MKRNNKNRAVAAAAFEKVNRFATAWEAIECMCMEYGAEQAVGIMESLLQLSLLGRECEGQHDDKPATTYLFVRHLQDLLPYLFQLQQLHPELFEL